MARSSESGVCQVATSNVLFNHVVFTESLLHLYSPDRNFSVDIEASDFSAALGVFPGSQDEITNELGGSITIWGSQRTIPVGDPGLVPDLDEEEFLAGGACKAGLTTPIDYTCNLEEGLGEGAARLAVLTLGSLLKTVQADEVCGFASDAVRASYQEHPTGNGRGSVTYDVHDCLIELDEPLSLGSDCVGVESWITGSIRIDAQKSVEGFLTGDPEAPVIPSGLDPGRIAIQAHLQDVAVTKSDSDAYLTFVDGRLSGIIAPWVMRNDSTGVCSITTPNAVFDQVSIEDASLQLFSAGNTLGFEVEAAALYAVNGVAAGAENHLEGTIVVDGTTVHVPRSGHRLNPEYDADGFRAAYLCEDHASPPRTEEDCNTERTLAETSARLITAAFASSVSAVNRDHSCGFANTLDSLLALVGEPALILGGEETVWFETDHCVIGSPDAQIWSEADCLGNRNVITGTASFEATKRVTGELFFSGHPLQPQDRESVFITIDDVEFTEFVTYKMDADGGIGTHLEFHSGNLSGQFHPITGEAISDPGSYYISTPVADIDIVAEDLVVTIRSGAKSIDLRIDRAELTAFNGSWHGRTNHIGGEIYVNGRRYELGELTGEALIDLDPSYDPAVFDAGYECIQNLREPVPAG
jgi:hypothetical protein